MSKQTFYFTFARSNSHPFYGGWAEVEAESLAEATKAFARKYGYTKDGFLRFSFSYTADVFRTTQMYTHDNFGARCQDRFHAEEWRCSPEGIDHAPLRLAGV